jgi:hypothetical protein
VTQPTTAVLVIDSLEDVLLLCSDHAPWTLQDGGSPEIVDR